MAFLIHAQHLSWLDFETNRIGVLKSTKLKLASSKNFAHSQSLG